LVKYYKSLGLVRAGAKDEFRGIRELEMKVEDLHLSLARMERAAAREQTAAADNSAREPSDKPGRESSKKGFAGLEDLERNPYIEAAPLTDRQKDCAHLKWSYGLTDTGDSATPWDLQNNGPRAFGCGKEKDGPLSTECEAKQGHQVPDSRLRLQIPCTTLRPNTLY
jgi:hypothetical protein